jgi:hypothetical protein
MHHKAHKAAIRDTILDVIGDDPPLTARLITRHISPARTMLRAAEESERELLRLWRPGGAA